MKYLFLLLCFFLLSCENKKKEYKYIDGLDHYMSNTFDYNIKNSKDDFFYYLPINECNSCEGTNLNLELLENNKIKSNVTIIIIGKEKLSKFNQRLLNIKHSKILYDNESIINNYKTGVLKPLLIHIVNGDNINFLEINDFSINKLKEVIIINN